MLLSQHIPKWAHVFMLHVLWSLHFSHVSYTYITELHLLFFFRVYAPFLLSACPSDMSNAGTQ